LASRAAPIITEGFEVLVHEVIAAIATAPWSTSTSCPSIETVTGLLGRPPSFGAADGLAGLPLPLAWLGASEAGNDSSTASS
jgi:hypothetical protein